MNLDELQSIRDRERQSDSLQQLRETFYEDAGELLSELRGEREEAAARADDPFDAPEVNRLTDDIKTAEQTVEAIYERRVGKLVKMASFAAADMPTEDEGLTAEERDLFEHLVDAIEHNRDHVLGVLDGDDDAGSTVPGGLPGSDAEPTETATAGSGESQTSEQPRETPPEPDRPQGPRGGPDQPLDETDAEAATSAQDGVDAADLMAGDASTDEGDSSVPPESTPPESSPQAAGDSDSAAQAPGDGGPDPDTSEGTSGAAEGLGLDATPETTTDGETATSEGESESTPTDGSTTSVVDQSADTASASRAAADADSEMDSTGSVQDETVTISRETVMITEEVGEIYGVDDRNYDLSSNDVVTLPSEHADLLVEQDAAQRLD
jgi:DNA replication factor GINS